MSFFRAGEIIKQEGIKTFFDVLKEKHFLRMSDKKRYSRYIQTVEPELKKRWMNYSNPKLKAKADRINISLCGISDMVLNINACDNDSYVGIRPDDSFINQTELKQLAFFIANYQRRGALIDFLYTDEDVWAGGERSNPVFKPDYSEQTLLSYNYIGGLWIAKASLIKSAINELKISLDKNNREEYEYELIKAMLVGKHRNVVHLNQVFLHRKTRKQCNIRHICYDVPKKTSASIVILSKDNPDMLAMCIGSIERNTAFTNYDIVVVDNGSRQENKSRYQDILNGFNERQKERNNSIKAAYIYEPMDFNFAKMCNMGAENSTGDCLVFLNDDIEIMESSKDWLTILLGQAICPGVGAVGAKLLYPNTNLIQHIGVVNQRISGFVHIFSKCVDNDSVRDYRNKADVNVLAVTGACLCITRENFFSVGGFDTELSVTHNDMDLCIKLYKKGLNQVVRNDVVLYHHESFSRGSEEEDEEKLRRSAIEREKLFKKHPEFENYDPFFSPSLSYRENDYRPDIKAEALLYKKPERVDIKKLEKLRKTCILQNEKNNECILEILMVEYREDLQIFGCAYDKSEKDKKAVSKIEAFLYNDSECYRLMTNRLLNRVYHRRKGLAGHINYACFEALVDTSYISEGDYKLLVCIPGKTFSETDIHV